jgi:hypothetical protein
MELALSVRLCHINFGTLLWLDSVNARNSFMQLSGRKAKVAKGIEMNSPELASCEPSIESLHSQPV